MHIKRKVIKVDKILMTKTTKRSRSNDTNAEEYVCCEDAACDGGESSCHNGVNLGLCQVRQHRPNCQRCVRL